jgi:hypothetical protein
VLLEKRPGAVDESKVEPKLPDGLLDELESLSAEISADPALTEALKSIEVCATKGPTP